MDRINEIANLAVAMAITSNTSFSEGVKRAREICAARDEFIEAYTPTVGKIAICRTNRVINPGEDDCLRLKVNNRYIVTGEDDEFIFVQDEATGEKIGSPFHKIRFEGVLD